VALTQFLSRTSQFADSRRAVIAATRSLFRKAKAAELSARIAAVAAAYDAVGIS
jgi:Zn-dependent metalloprotease